MADLRLTHDPESGCGECPLREPCTVERLWGHRAHRSLGWGAPPDCPLRSGTVTVAPPGEKSPPDGGER